MNQPIDLTIGSDPELMLWDIERNTMGSALRILKNRDKKKPIDLKDGIMMYADNVLDEFRHPPVTANHGPEPFISMLMDSTGRMQEYLGPKFSLIPKASFNYDMEELGASKIVDGEESNPAWNAGCMPNSNVYTDTLRTREDMAEDFRKLGTLRTGSFHIHLGNGKWAQEDGLPLLTHKTKEDAIRLLDIYLGTASVLFDRDTSALDRRKLYGKAGEYRPTPYGVEYRVLGPWALHSAASMGLVFSLAEFAIRKLETPDYKEILDLIDGHYVQEAINTCNKDLAKNILRKAEIPTANLSACLKD